MGDINIEKLNVDNVQLLHDVAVKAYSDHYLHLWYEGGAAWYIKRSFAVEQLTKELNDTNAAFYLARYQNNPVGFLKLNIDAALEGDNKKDALELERIYLNKDATGKGIGRVLVQLTFDISKELHKQYVWLKAMDSSEESIAFYRRMGFKTIATYVLPHELMKKELRGMVIMKKVL